MHSMPYARYVFVEHHIHNYHYLFWHQTHCPLYTSAGRTTTHWGNFRPLATDASNEYDIMLCVCMIHPHTVGFSLQSQVGRWLILCALAVCSWSKKRTKFLKCPAELSNNYSIEDSNEMLLLDDAGSLIIPLPA